MNSKLLPVGIASLALLCVFVSSAPAIEFLSPGDISSDGIRPQHDESCVVAYEQTDVSFFLLNPDGEIFDDLHLENPGNHQLCAFSVRMRNIGGGGMAEVNFYENDDDAAPSGVVVAGPFLLTIPSAFNGTIHVEVQDATIPQNVWMGMRFPGVAGFGWGMAGPTGDPTIGTSHDFYYLSPQNSFEDSDDNKANTATILYTVPVPVQTEVSTWGRLKSTYR